MLFAQCDAVLGLSVTSDGAPASRGECFAVPRFDVVVAGDLGVPIDEWNDVGTRPVSHPRRVPEGAKKEPHGAHQPNPG